MAVIAARTFDSSIDDVWDALTNPERIPCWFLPVTGDLRLGGRFVHRVLHTQVHEPGHIGDRRAYAFGVASELIQVLADHFDGRNLPW